MGNGNGAASNANGFLFYAGTNAGGGGYPVMSGPAAISGAAQANGGSLLFSGNALLTFTMGKASESTVDHLYVNGTEDPGYSSATVTSAGLQTVGNYQLGGCTNGSGFATVDSGTYMVGNVYYAVFYNRMLSAAEVAQNAGAIQAILANRGVNPFGLFNTQTSDQIIAMGDSITQGAGLGTAYTGAMNALINGASSFKILNNGLGGYSAQKEAATAAAGLHVEPTYSPFAFRNVMIYWAGINDVNIGSTAAQTFGWQNEISRYVRQRQAKTVMVTMLDRVTLDAAKNSLDTLMRTNWPILGDGFADPAADARLGADGAQSNTTWFQDGTHPTQASAYNIIAPIITRAVNRIYGNLDFSTATVYTATRPTATVSNATQSGNTVTITTSASHGFAVGEMATIAGVTPAGYNGTRQILTAPTGTTFTYYDENTGLANLSVAGTANCPLLRDVDVFAVLGASAGGQVCNLQSSVGLTGQNISIKNVDTHSWTVTPFSTETIDGVATITLPAGAEITLQSRLVSSSAAGSNWVSVANGGSPTLVATSLLTAQAAAIPATTIYAIPAGKAGLYRINYVATITTVDATSCTLGGTNGFQIKFTNANGDSVVKTSNPTTPNISAVNATGTTISGVVYGYAAASTNLQYLFGYTAAGGQMRFDLATYAEYLG